MCAPSSLWCVNLSLVGWGLHVCVLGWGTWRERGGSPCAEPPEWLLNVYRLFALTFWPLHFFVLKITKKAKRLMCVCVCGTEMLCPWNTRVNHPTHSSQRRVAYYSVWSEQQNCIKGNKMITVKRGEKIQIIEATGNKLFGFASMQRRAIGNYTLHILFMWR